MVFTHNTVVFTEGGIYRDLYWSGEKGQPLMEDELEKTKNFSQVQNLQFNCQIPKLPFSEISMVINRV